MTHSTVYRVARHRQKTSAESCPKNNLYLVMKIESVPAGADATIYEYVRLNQTPWSSWNRPHKTTNYFDRAKQGKTCKVYGAGGIGTLRKLIILQEKIGLNLHSIGVRLLEQTPWRSWNRPVKELIILSGQNRIKPVQSTSQTTGARSMEQLKSAL